MAWNAVKMTLNTVHRDHHDPTYSKKESTYIDSDGELLPARTQKIRRLIHDKDITESKIISVKVSIGKYKERMDKLYISEVFWPLVGLDYEQNYTLIHPELSTCLPLCLSLK